MSDQIIEIDEDGKVTVHMADCCRAAVQAEREVCIQMFTKIKAGIPLEDIIDAIRGETRTAQEEAPNG